MHARAVHPLYIRHSYTNSPMNNEACDFWRRLYRYNDEHMVPTCIYFYKYIYAHILLLLSIPT